MLDYDTSDTDGWKKKYIALHNEVKHVEHTYGIKNESGATFYSTIVDLFSTTKEVLNPNDFAPGCLVDVVWTPVLRKWSRKWSLSADLLMVIKLSSSTMYKQIVDATLGPAGFTTPKKQKLAGLDL